MAEKKRKTSEAQLRAYKEWRIDHRQQYNAYMKDWRLRNPDKFRESQIRYRLRHDRKLKLQVEQFLEELSK